MLVIRSRYPRIVPPFIIHSEFRPAGDQPKAIEQLAAGINAGRPLPDAARDNRVGEVGHHRLDHRGGAAPHARDRPQQGAGRAAGQRVPPVLPREPGGVLRLLLRLLPARGVHPPDRHLHRERRHDQRRDRPAPPRRHLGAAGAGRHDHRRLGLVHLRPWLSRAVLRPASPAGPGGRLPDAGGDPPAGRHRLPAQRGGSHPGPFPGQGRHPRRLPFVRGDGGQGRVLRRHRRSDAADGHGHRRGDRGTARGVRLPRIALRDRPGAHGEGDRGDRGELGERLAELERRREAARGAAAPDADQLRPRDAARGGDLLGDRELQPLSRRPLRR